MKKPQFPIRKIISVDTDGWAELECGHVEYYEYGLTQLECPQCNHCTRDLIRKLRGRALVRTQSMIGYDVWLDIMSAVDREVQTIRDAVEECIADKEIPF